MSHLSPSTIPNRTKFSSYIINFKVVKTNHDIPVEKLLIRTAKVKKLGKKTMRINFFFIFAKRKIQ
jgi:hypothetical protein